MKKQILIALMSCAFVSLHAQNNLDEWQAQQANALC
jgi:hypothetical protein